MVSFNKLTRTLAGIAAAALIVPLAACGGSGNGGTATAEGIPAKGTDDGTEITLWTRSPLERQAKRGRGLQQEPQEPGQARDHPERRYGRQGRRCFADRLSA